MIAIIPTVKAIGPAHLAAACRSNFLFKRYSRVSQVDDFTTGVAFLEIAVAGLGIGCGTILGATGAGEWGGACVVTGAPQCGQESAFVDTWPLHSGHEIRAMV